MKRKDQNFMNMTNATIQVLVENQSIWGTNTKVTAYVTSIQNDAAAVETERQAADIVSTGATTDKELAGRKASLLCVKLAGFGAAYALDKDNHTLHDELEVYSSSLDRMSGGKLVAKMKSIHTKLASLDPVETAEYGITPAELTQFEQAIKAFDSMKSTPRTIITSGKTHNANIPALLRNIRNTFYRLDKLILIFETDHPDFVSQYKNARIIIDLRGGGNNNPQS